MRIEFDFPHVFAPGASSTEDAEVLRAMLDMLIRVNIDYLRRHPNTPPLYRAGVTYARTEVWDSIPALYTRRYGDCKSLTAARVAELTVARVDALPTFRFNPRKNGAKDFHILVQRYGGWEDPSRKLGMGANEAAYFTLEG